MATVIEFLLQNLWLPVVLLGLYVVFRLRGHGRGQANESSDGESRESAGLPNPDAVVAGTRVMRMAVTGHVRVVGPAGEQIVDLPPSPFGEGEMPEAIWGVPGGPIFVVGKLYSGEPGPDHGAIYRKDPGGEWQLVHVETNYTLHRVCGASAEEVYAAGINGVVYFNGHEFEFLTTEYQMMNKCWREGDMLVLQAFDGSETHRLEQGVLIPIDEREEPDYDRRTWSTPMARATPCSIAPSRSKKPRSTRRRPPRSGPSSRRCARSCNAAPAIRAAARRRCKRA